MGDTRAEYLHGLKRVARRARCAVVLCRLVNAALAGLGAGFAYLVVRPFLPAAFTLAHPLVAPAILLALALIAGALVALTIRLDRAALAVQVDRSLGTRGLASAALEIAEGRRSSAFADALVEDASTVLRAAGPRGVIARPRLRLLPWTLAAAVVVLVAGLSPYTLRDIFPARQPVDRLIAILGGELEESARRLEDAVARQDLREGLELSRELAQLGKDLAMQDVPAEELYQRLAEMERRAGQEYEMMLQRFHDRSRPTGTGEGDGSGTEGGDVEPVPGPGGDEVDPSSLPPGARELAEALELLRELRERSTPRTAGEGRDGSGGEGAPGSPGDRGGDGEGEGLAGGEEGEGTEGDPAASPAAGTSAVSDERGAATDIARGNPAEVLETEAPVGEGEMARMLVRALPEANSAALGEERVLAEYRRQAESALAAEEVPLALRDYVRRYFTGIGILGN